ncbi:hypothetical protein FRC03_012608 [Tulasnella sp. 419]|nr:hypothetical protein FRC02_002150 [Tulasnella sp. 418]KAG8966032.1 hypothetical protein FRC03_012608 [Tulasnella sp. 419]
MAPRTPLGDDPLEIAMRPPANETAAERAERIAAEQEAIRISAEIDEMLKAERLAAKKRRTHEVKVLLLGQEA